MEARLESSIAHAPGVHPGTLEDEAVSGAEDADSMPLQSGPQTLAHSFIPSDLFSSPFAEGDRLPYPSTSELRGDHGNVVWRKAKLIPVKPYT
ncbi:hypothetical protein C0Q70_16281 [Pomacea canaliculata]|uniref:Uncharacterized protein n=1 Tax=Pomacea canaliculata TaxID=400727 RepID=A0A2T7NPC2_POMCA|nr:hypothetical protein C0Q70_16281 [Pomacea canaliculata]